MLVKEYTVLPIFLKTLFDFFKKYNIYSCFDPLTDYNSLYEIILNSSIVEWKYTPDIEYFSLTLATGNDGPTSTYYFVFSDESGTKSHHFLCEIYYEKGFLQFAIEPGKYLPIINDFIDSENRLRVSHIQLPDELIKINQSAIMTMDEFDSFLTKNSHRQSLICFEVD